jgi:acyl carrier protein
MDQACPHKIVSIVAAETRLCPTKLTSTARFESLGVSWLDLAPAIFALEQEFGIELPMGDYQGDAEFVTVADLVAHVLAHAPAPQHVAG